MKAFKKLAGLAEALAQEVPTGALTGALPVRPAATQVSGWPKRLNACCYSPSQRLLAAATDDGRVLLLGGPGNQVFLASPSAGEGTAALGMLPGTLLRLSTGGELEVWSLQTMDLVEVAAVEFVTCFAAVPASPFLLVGCRSGAVRVLRLLRHSDANTVTSIEELAYCVDPDQAGSSDSASVLTVQPRAEDRRVLVGYADGCLCLWDIPGKKAVATTDAGEALQRVGESGRVAAVAWLGDLGDRLVAGYGNGDVFIWGLPTEARPKYQAPQAPAMMEPLAQVHGAGSGPRAPIKFLSVGIVPEAGLAGGGDGAARPSVVLFVLGGNDEGEMDRVRKLDLDGGFLHGRFEDLRGKPCVLRSSNFPWFGPVAGCCLISPGGAAEMDQASHLAVLTEGGQIHFHEALGEEYFPYTSELQACPEVTAAHFAAVRPGEAPYLGDGRRGGGCLAQPHFERILRPHSAEASCTGLLATSHRDGQVRGWALTEGGFDPVLAFSTSQRDSISSLAMCAVAGLVVTASDGGDVEVFAWCRQGALVSVVDVRSGVRAMPVAVAEGSFQRVAVLSGLHTSPIRCVEIASGLEKVALGDCNGRVSVIDLAKRALDFSGPCFQEACNHLQFWTKASGAGEDPTPFLAATSESSSIVFVSVPTGATVPHSPVVPKNPGRNYASVLLDSDGLPVASVARHFDPSVFSEAVPSLEPGGGAARSAGLSEGGAGEEDPDDSMLLEEALDDMERKDRKPPSRVTRESEDPALPRPGRPLALTSAVYYATCSDSAIRLYSVDLLMRGERTTLRKAPLAEHVAAMKVFETPRAPVRGCGCCVITDRSDVLIVSLPDLQTVWKSSLGACIGWRLSSSLCDDSVLAASGLCTDDALVVLRGPEAIRIEITGQSTLSKSNRMYDIDLDIAAEAAAANRLLPSQPAAADPPSPELSGKGAGFGGFMDRAKKTFALPGRGGDKKLFPAPRLSSQELEEIFGVSRSSGAQGMAAVTPREGLAAPSSSKRDSRAAHRPELSGGGRRYPAKARTADEIRAAYGRPARRAADRARSLSGAMAQNKDLLVERGERLNDLSEKTRELQDEAENFAAMAGRLADQQQKPFGFF